MSPRLPRDLSRTRDDTESAWAREGPRVPPRCPTPPSAESSRGERQWGDPERSRAPTPSSPRRERGRWEDPERSRAPAQSFAESPRRERGRWEDPERSSAPTPSFAESSYRRERVAERDRAERTEYISDTDESPEGVESERLLEVARKKESKVKEFMAMLRDVDDGLIPDLTPLGRENVIRKVAVLEREAQELRDQNKKYEARLNEKVQRSRKEHKRSGEKKVREMKSGQKTILKTIVYLATMNRPLPKDASKKSSSKASKSSRRERK